MKRSALALLLVATLACLVAAPAMPGRGNSAATITGSFGDSCRDFTAHSSKDISHVELHYADGRVVKDERITRPDYSLDGGPGGELDYVLVKSGTTRSRFDCVRSNSPPTAVLEVKTPAACFTWDDGLVNCDGTTARTAWMHSTVPSVGYGLISFTCGFSGQGPCLLHEDPCGSLDFYSLCRITYTFRGTSSTDPDNDIVSWSLDFGDGTSTSGSWITNPPTEISHEYQIHYCPTCTRDPATLTVTDSAGQTDSDQQFAFRQYPD